MLRVLPVNKTGGAENMARAETLHFLNTGIQDVIYLYSPQKSKGLSLLHGILKLLKALRNDNYTLIVSSLWPVVPVIFLCRVILWPRHFQWIHFVHSETFFSKFDFLFNYLAIRFANGVLCDSSASAALVRGYRHSMPLEIVRPVMKIGNYPLAQKNISNSFNFITWGRIKYGKNIDYGIRLVSELVARGGDASLIVVGPDEDNLMPWLNQVSIDHNVSDRIKFFGQMSHDEIYKAATNCNYFIVTSSHEGLCIALTEAMQLGLLPVVTLVGGIREYCIDGKNCIEVNLLNVPLTAERLIRLSAHDRNIIVASAINTFDDSHDYVRNYFNVLKKMSKKSL